MIFCRHREMIFVIRQWETSFTIDRQSGFFVCVCVFCILHSLSAKHVRLCSSPPEVLLDKFPALFITGETGRRQVFHTDKSHGG